MRKNFYLNVFATLLITMVAVSLSGQVVINEVSAANRNVIQDNYGEREDWLELYNAGSSAVDLSGYFLSDRIDNPTKWEIPAGVTIGPDDYLIVFASKRDEVSGGYLHADFKLTQTKLDEVVSIANPAGLVLDIYEITVPNKLDHSYGRSDDGTGSWGVYTNPTPGGPNGGPFYPGGYAAKPSLSVEAGFYPSSISVIIANLEPNSEIRYTLNGQEPTATSNLYTGPIDVNETRVIRAASFSTDPGTLSSFIETNTYFIDVTHTIPTISIAGNQIESLLDGSFLEPIASFELFESDGELIDESVGEYNKHGNDSWAYPQRGIDYITRDQFGYSAEINHQIFPQDSDRDGFQRLIIKAAANDNYPFEDGAHIRDAYIHTLSHRAGMELDERTNRACVMYVNGKYWGLYEIREKVDDHDYTRYYYDQGEEWIDFIKTWGGTWEEYGSWDDWYDLHDFIVDNDMTVQSNYDYVESEFNLTSLADYMILNTHVVCKDWLNWNTAWWRGNKPTGEALRWRYALWDLDATFGHYINYTGIPNDSPTADPCDNEDLGGFGDPEGHVDLVISLMENDDFHALYVNRYADFNNTYFTCDYMIGLLDSMINELAPEMPAHIDRWGGSVAEWESNVQDLKDFIETRCTVIDGGISDCYDVEGPYPVLVKIFPENSPNAVKVNTLVPPEFPFEGDYFSGVDLTFTAVPDPEWEFHHWEVLNHSFGPDQYAIAIELAIDMEEEIEAYFVPAIPCAQPDMVEVEPSFSTADISWQGAFNTLSYEVKWRKTGTGDAWSNVSSLNEEHTIFGLEPCTEYDLEVRAICETSTSEAITTTFETECNSVSVEEVIGLLDMQVYPNPFKDALTLDLVLATGGNVQIDIRSLDGRVLYSYSEDMAAGLRRIPLNSMGQWASGMYLIQVTTEAGTTVRKVMKD